LEHLSPKIKLTRRGKNQVKYFKEKREMEFKREKVLEDLKKEGAKPL
jgi:hypothetical protein